MTQRDSGMTHNLGTQRPDHPKLSMINEMNCQLSIAQQTVSQLAESEYPIASSASQELSAPSCIDNSKYNGSITNTSNINRNESVIIVDDDVTNSWAVPEVHLNSSTGAAATRKDEGRSDGSVSATAANTKMDDVTNVIKILSSLRVCKYDA